MPDTNGHFEEDHAIALWIQNVVFKNAATLVKIPTIALMAGFSVAVFANSILKGMVVAGVCLLISCFRMWRRPLQPIAFWSFVVAVVVWCEPNIFAKMQLAFLH